MSIKLEDKIIVDMAGIHKFNNEEYCHIVFKVYEINCPLQKMHIKVF